MHAATSYKRAALKGALIATAGVFVYSLAVMLYVIIRTSIYIYMLMPATERNIILLTNAFSIAYAVAVFSLLMCGPSALAGAVAGVLLKTVLIRYNPLRSFNKSIQISSLSSLVLLAVLYLIFYRLLKERITLHNAETLLFWYVFPSIIFFISMVTSGVKFNRHLINEHKKAQVSQ